MLWLARGNELSRSDDESELIGSAPQAQVERDQAAAEDLRERHVFGIVGSGVAELIGETPGTVVQVVGRSPLQRRRIESLQQEGSSLVAELGSEPSLVHEREELGPQQRRRDQLVVAERREAVGLGARSYRDVGIEDERQCPRRERSSNATQLGTGAPSSNVRQAWGSSAISGSPSDSTARSANSACSSLQLGASASTRSLAVMLHRVSPEHHGAKGNDRLANYEQEAARGVEDYFSGRGERQVDGLVPGAVASLFRVASTVTGSCARCTAAIRAPGSD